MSIQQVLRGSAATISVTFQDQDGNPRAAGDTTVTVTRADGTALVTDGAAVDGATEGVKAFTLSAADTATLDRLTATWSEDGGSIDTSSVDIVGGYYFTPAEARTAGPKLSDEDKYPDALILSARRAVEEECERITGRSFVPRFRRVVLNGSDRETLWLPNPDVRRVRALSVDGAAVLPEDTLIQGAAGHITARRGAFGYGNGNVVVTYEYGLDAPPQRIKTAALIRVRDVLSSTKTGVPDRATFQIVDGRVFGVPQPGVRGSSTGIPEVDAAYEEWAFHRGTAAAVPI